MAHPPIVTFPLFDTAQGPATAHEDDREEGEQNRDRCEGLTHHGTRMDQTTKGRLKEYGTEFAKSKKKVRPIRVKAGEALSPGWGAGLNRRGELGAGRYGLAGGAWP